MTQVIQSKVHYLIVYFANIQFVDQFRVIIIIILIDDEEYYDDNDEDNSKFLNKFDIL